MCWIVEGIREYCTGVDNEREREEVGDVSDKEGFADYAAFILRIEFDGGVGDWRLVGRRRRRFQVPTDYDVYSSTHSCESIELPARSGEVGLADSGHCYGSFRLYLSGQPLHEPPYALSMP